MARQAIISDIHGNLLALDAVMRDINDQKVDEIVCIGDIAGYGPDPIECIDIVREKCKWVLCGNHDAALFMISPIGFNKIAKDAIEWQRTILEPHWYSMPATKERWNWISSLKPSKLDGKVLYVHASPREPLLEYVEESDVVDMGFGPPQKIVEIFEKIPWVCFCGHSHRPGVVTQYLRWVKPHELDEEMTYYFPKDQKTLVNIGSVGQPRDQNPNSCYVIFDTVREMITFRRVGYDVAAAQERFKTIKALDQKCWKRLAIGM